MINAHLVNLPKSFTSKCLISFISGCLCLCLLAYTDHAHAIKIIHVTDNSLSAIKEKLNKLKEALGYTEEKKQAATEDLKASEVAISQSNKKLYELEQETNKNTEKQAALATALVASKEQLKQQKISLSKQLYHQYTIGQQDYLQLILQDKSPAALSRDMAYFNYIAKARTRAIDTLAHNLEEQKSLTLETQAALEEAEQLKAAQIEQQALLKKQKQKKAKVVASLSNKAKEQRSAIEKLKQDEKSLTKLVVTLDKQSTKKSQAITQKKPSGKVIATNQYEPDSSTNSNRFKTLKGKLRLPVKGQLMNRYGSRRTETGINWKGLFISADEGTHVKSVAQGKVVFANWMRGFGNLIIIDHGSGYMSLYGNNQSVLKSVGDKVKSGDTIATVGNTGGNDRVGLYYELRKRSKPFDPLKWSKL